MIDKLKKIYGIDIKAPFSLTIGDKTLIFQCLVLGYGAKKGMIVDKEWQKISTVKNEIVEMGFGFSCFDIEKSSIVGFQEVLDDWGKIID